MKRSWIDLFVVAVVVLAVHHRALTAEVGGRDAARAAGVRTPAFHEPPVPGEIPETDVSGLIQTVERAICGASHARHMAFGLALVILAGWALASGFRALSVARPDEATKSMRSLPFDGALIAGVVWAASPLQSDAATSVAGHSALVAAAVFGLTLRLAIRSPNTLSLFLGPTVLSVAFLETFGSTFLLVPVFALVARVRPRRVLARRSVQLLVVALVILRVGLDVIAPVTGARDVGDPSASYLTRLLIDARTLLAPTVESGTSPRFAWILAGSYAAIVLALGMWGHVKARAWHKGPARAGGIGIALAIAWCALRPGVGIDLADAREMLPGLVALSLLVGVSVDAVARTRESEITALSMVVFLGALGWFCVGPSLAARSKSLFPDELFAVEEALDRTAPDADRIILFGVVAEPRRAALEAAIPARQRMPWRAHDRDVVVVPTTLYNAMDGALLEPGIRTAICEWSPTMLPAIMTRPRGWAPKVILDARLEGGPSRLRLLTPRDEEEVVVVRPETVPDDFAFEFEVEAADAPTDHETFVFYSVFDGPVHPRGRQRLSTRRLPPSVLTTVEAPEGIRRYRWRPAVRSGPGADGVALEDPDLGLGGKTLWWTIGIAGRSDGTHAGHDHGAPNRPRRVAQTRRTHFVMPVDR